MFDALHLRKQAFFVLSLMFKHKALIKQKFNNFPFTPSSTPVFYGWVILVVGTRITSYNVCYTKLLRDAEYNQAIQQGDQSVSDKAYDNAIAQYQQALKLKPKEQYPADQIEKVKQLQAEQFKAEQLERSYNNYIAKADSLFKLESYP